MIPVIKTILMTSLGTAAMVAAAQSAPVQTAHRSAVTSSGTAKVRVDPDMATVTLAVEVQANDAAKAQSLISTKVTALSAALHKFVKDDKAYRTVNVYLNPVYSEPKPGQSEAPKVVGFRAHNSLEVRVDELNLVGKLIDAGVNAGADSLESVSFSLKDETLAQLPALAEATAKAKLKADAMATAAGYRLDALEEISDSSEPIQPIFRNERPRFAAMSEKAIMPGQIEVSVTVTTRWSLIR